MAKSAGKAPAKKQAKDSPVMSAGREWSPFENLRREIDRLFEDFRPFGWHLPASSRADADKPAAGRSWIVNPAFDVVEKDAEYRITAELPGLSEDDVEIKLNNNLLTIKGEKTESEETEEKDYYLSERRFGSFQRSFRVPDGVDTEQIAADFAKGVLTIRLPKTTEGRQAEKKIPVKSS